MAKRPVPKYDFKAFGAAIKAAREGRKESRKKVGDEMFISPRYLANIENKGQHPSLQIFFELIQRYHISVDQFLKNDFLRLRFQRVHQPHPAHGVTGFQFLGDARRLHHAGQHGVYALPRRPGNLQQVRV